ncbi:MAG: RNA polymerase sigma factor [Myxococcota bacterium]|nr:RNA polymerase sigma factor [Myxococcota bacterium]
MMGVHTAQGVMIETRQFNSDKDLVAQCLKGDEVAMQTLYQQHSNRIYLLAIRLLGNRADAEEVVQECFLKAWRNIGTFRGDAAIGTWLCRIGVNLCRDRLKKPRPRDSELEVGTPPRVPDTFARKHLENALALLPDRFREVLVMHDVMGMKHGEIAAVLNIAVGTSKSQLHKSRAQMRRLLTRAGVSTAKE